MGKPLLSESCCGCTLRTSAKIIGWLYVIFSILSIIGAFSGSAQQPKPHSDDEAFNEFMAKYENLPGRNGAINIIINVIYLIVSVLLLKAAYDERPNPNHILPWVIVSGLHYILSLIFAGIMVVACFVIFSKSIGIAVVILIFVLIAMAFSAYLIALVYSFYKVADDPSNDITV